MKNTIENKLSVLFEAYAKELPNKVTLIEQNWESLTKAPWEVSSWQIFHRSIHSLVGSSGSYGFDEISKKFRALEQSIEPFLTHAPSIVQCNEISKQLADIKERLQDAQAQPIRSIIPKKLN